MSMESIIILIILTVYLVYIVANKFSINNLEDDVRKVESDYKDFCKYSERIQKELSQPFHKCKKCNTIFRERKKYVLDSYNIWTGLSIKGGIMYSCIEDSIKDVHTLCDRCGSEFLEKYITKKEKK